MYKLIVLIVSSHDQPVYAKMKMISQKYHELYKDQIKYFYIEHADINEDVKEDGNHIYVKGSDNGVSINMYLKTMKAIEYISKTYDYEFIMRTNLSSFLHLDNILTHLQTIPKIKFAGGHFVANFISGTGIFISKDVGDMLFKNINMFDEYEDVNISSNIRNCGIDLVEFKNIQYLIRNIYDCNIVIPEGVLYYRIKNEADRNIDIQYFELLLNKIYQLSNV